VSVSRQPEIHQIAAAVIRRGDDILLVQQQGSGDPYPTWALPGGVAGPGELLSEALAREVHEETGLIIRPPIRLLYFVQLDDLEDGSQSQAFVFEVENWEGQVRTGDPDGLVREAGFFSLSEAVLKLEQLPWRAMREPILAYLQGHSVPGAAWFYRRAPGQAETTA
jgi:8-oxo-dGTP diphosphatase